MNRAARAALPLVMLLVSSAAGQPAPAPAPDPAALRGESAQTRKRLAEAEQKLLSGKAADAADDLQRILDEVPDDLVALDANRHRTARWVAHGLLAKLPPDALKAYQDRTDQPAKRLLEQAARDRDPRPLWALLDRYFASRPADDALLLLGELLFERGEFRAAETQWRRLLPDAGADVVYPNTKADPALVRARVAIAVIFQNDTARAKAEVAMFKAKHATASGTLAGTTGPLIDTLTAFLDAPPKLAPDATSGTAWPTFGGSPDRTARVPGGIPSAWPGRPTWTTADKPLTVTGAGTQPFGHPVIVNGEVFVANGSHLYGFDLRAGTSRRRDEIALLRDVPPGDFNCTLTAADGLLYARVGPAAVRAPVPNGSGTNSYLVCLRPKPGELAELWRLAPPEDPKTPAVWEGAPVVSGRKLWAVYTKFDGARVVQVAACFDPADAATRPLWTTELCDAAQGNDRTRQELLTLAGRHVVFCSNSGAVVAVDAATGRRAWGFRYPRAKKAAPGASADPAPAVAFGGRVFVAPADGERVYALDAETGALVWESGPVEGAKVLGVSRGRLVVAVAGPVRSLRALDLATGSHRATDGGWIQDTHGTLSHGQALVTDDAILWPSRDGLYVLDARDGRPARGGTPNPRPAVRQNLYGHLAYANGVLVVVTGTQVWGFRAESDKIDPLPDATPRERFDAHIDRAEREQLAGNVPKALATLSEVASGDLPAPLRAWAAARALQIAPPATDVARLAPEVRAALRPELMGEWVLAPDGVPVTLEAFLQRRLGRSLTPGSIPSATASAPVEHTLTEDSDIAHTLKLPPAVAPLRSIPGAGAAKHMFAAGPKALLAIPLDRRAVANFVAADMFSHAADLRSGFVAAGPFAVAVYGTGREPLWVFRVPDTERLPDGAPFRFRRADESDAPHLSSFVLAGPWLLARVGESHLIALDLDAQRVSWVLNSAGRAGFEAGRFGGAPRFRPRFAVHGKFVVAQLSDGRRWFIDLRTGRPVVQPGLGDHTARGPWPHAPLAFDGRLLLADGPGLVRLVELGGRVKWAFEAERDDGLTGEPAQVWARGDVVLIAVRRNNGVEIERAGASDGKATWSRGPAFADADRIDLTAAVADTERAYVPVANKLLALALATGKTAWEVELPGASAAGWVVRAGKSGLLVYPAAALPAEPARAMFDRLARSFAREPYMWRLPALAGTLYDSWAARAAPVLLLDPETGKQLARFDVHARGPALTAYLTAGAAVVATGDRVVWIK
jgi:outer membrane protein assembly factor BamB